MNACSLCYVTDYKGRNYAKLQASCKDAENDVVTISTVLYHLVPTL